MTACLIMRFCLGPKTSQFPYYPSASSRWSYGEDPLLPNHFVPCSKKAKKSTLRKKYSGLQGFLWGWREGDWQDIIEVDSPWAGRRDLPCIVMVRMLTALSALCLWKGSLCSSRRSTDRFWDSRLVCSRRCGYERKHGGPSKGRSSFSSKLDKLLCFDATCSTDVQYLV